MLIHKDGDNRNISDLGGRFVNSVLEMLVLRDFERDIRNSKSTFILSGSCNGGLTWRRTPCVCSVQVGVIP